MWISINKNILGSNKHLIVNEHDFSWSLDDPSHIANFTFGFKDHPRSIEPLLSLYDIAISSISTDREINTFRSCDYASIPPWPLVLGKAEFLNRAIKICDELKRAAMLLVSKKYTDVFLEGNIVLGSLVDARVDNNILKELSASSENATLRHYSRSLSGSISEAPVYNRVKTKTGRLTIKRGPPILTLPKTTRSAYTSQFVDGMIVEIDFTSLEPRCASNLAGNDFTDHDLYSYLQKTLNIPAERDSIKELVISLLYGAGDSRARKILQKGAIDKNISNIFQAVKNFFNLDKMKNELLLEAKSGQISNFFGRPILVDSLQPGVLVNNFIQSSAVDLALLGFGELVDKFDTRKAKPLFIIHDALIIDTTKEYISEIKSLAGDYYKHEDLGIFPWKIRSI
jgi:hypothetical protein